MVLIVFFCASAVALSAAPATATACVSLRKVTSFHGRASASIVALTSGSDPESGGTETIGFGRVAQQLAINLTEKVSPNRVPDAIDDGRGISFKLEIPNSDNAPTFFPELPINLDNAGHVRANLRI